MFLLSHLSAKKESLFCFDSEKQYDREGKGSYILFFTHDSRRLAIDSTEENGTFGRLINHSSKSPNVVMKVVKVERQPVVVFVALQDIEENSELMYDYGERRREVLQENAWMKS